jgi:hypothetical protein
MEIKNIIEGAINTVFKKDHIEELYKKRKEICDQCEKKDNEKNTCKVCGCYLEIKLRATFSHCPMYKWLPEPL